MLFAKKKRKRTLTKGSKVVQDLAVKRANQRMRKEVLPLLGRTHPRPTSWNPLRDDINGPSAYGVKLWVSDALVFEILKSDDLLDLTGRIVLEETVKAAMTERQAFVTNIFDQLRDDNE